MNIFISHRRADKGRADRLRRELRNRIASPLLEVVISADYLDGQRHIALKEAHILFILYADEQTTWNPQGFEAGVFQANKNPRALRTSTYIVHSPKAKVPVGELQATDVCVDTKNFDSLDTNLLEPLFKEPRESGEPIYKDIFDPSSHKALSALHSSFVKAVGGVRERANVMGGFTITLDFRKMSPTRERANPGSLPMRPCTPMRVFLVTMKPCVSS